MVEQVISDDNGGNWWNPLSYLGGGYNAQLGQEGDANIGSGLVNVTKKEVRTSTQNSNQFSDSRDYSRSSVVTNTDARAFTLTNAPTLVFGSTGGNVTGSNTSVAPSTNVQPTLQTKKEQATSLDNTQKTDQSEANGLDLNKIGLYLAVGGVVYLLATGGVKALKSTPQAKAVKKAVGKK